METIENLYKSSMNLSKPTRQKRWYRLERQRKPSKEDTVADYIETPKIRKLRERKEQTDNQLADAIKEAKKNYQDRRTHLLCELGGMLVSRDVFDYDPEVWGDKGNRQKLMKMFLDHSWQLRDWAKQYGVTLPAAESPEPQADHAAAPEVKQPTYEQQPWS